MVFDLSPFFFAPSVFAASGLAFEVFFGSAVSAKTDENGRHKKARRKKTRRIMAGGGNVGRMRGISVGAIPLPCLPEAGAVPAPEGAAPALSLFVFPSV